MIKINVQKSAEGDSGNWLWTEMVDAKRVWVYLSFALALRISVDVIRYVPSAQTRFFAAAWSRRLFSRRKRKYQALKMIEFLDDRNDLNWWETRAQKKNATKYESCGYERGVAITNSKMQKIIRQLACANRTWSVIIALSYSPRWMAQIIRLDCEMFLIFTERRLPNDDAVHSAMCRWLEIAVFNGLRKSGVFFSFAKSTDIGK